MPPPVPPTRGQRDLRAPGRHPRLRTTVPLTPPGSRGLQSVADWPPGRLSPLASALSGPPLRHRPYIQPIANGLGPFFVDGDSQKPSFLPYRPVPARLVPLYRHVGQRGRAPRLLRLSPSHLQVLLALFCRLLAACLRYHGARWRRLRRVTGDTVLLAHVSFRATLNRTNGRSPGHEPNNDLCRTSPHKPESSSTARLAFGRRSRQRPAVSAPRSPCASRTSMTILLGCMPAWSSQGRQASQS